MKGLILAAACAIFFLSLCALALRVYRGEQVSKVFVGSIICSVILYVALFGVLSSNLGFLGKRWLEPSASVDFWNGMLIMVMALHATWTFSYMVVEGGPSIRLLVELSRTRSSGLTSYDALDHFQQGSAGNALLLSRLRKLVEGGYIAELDGEYALLPRGRAAGKMVLRLKRAIGDVE